MIELQHFRNAILKSIAVYRYTNIDNEECHIEMIMASHYQEIQVQSAGCLELFDDYTSCKSF